ncbi:MAG TPA: hypothetical protein VNQ76_05380 [Planctomicrobium sp.]|nr:hypothetical protein [Planctomicrobium sp.]
MAEMKLADARELCTQNELELYQASRGRPLSSQTAAELQKNVTRSRKLRDKWRDLATKQTRALQQVKRTRVVDKTDRSSQKAQLFQEVLERFEKRHAVVSAKETREQTSAKKTSRITKTERNAGHRQTRAETRKELRTKEKKLQYEQNEAGGTNGKVPHQTASPESKDAVPSKPASRKRKSSTHPAAGQATPNPGLQVDAVQQQEVQAAINENRQQKTGLTTRIRGHVSSRGKRDQAARNTRKRT